MPLKPAIPDLAADEADMLEQLDAFDRAWRNGPPPSINAFLAGATDGRNAGPLSFSRIRLLRELIKIDLEYRWTKGSSGAPKTSEDPCALPPRPKVETYLERWPELAADDASLELLSEEYRVRRRTGERPAADEFVQRFAHLDADALRDRLALVEREGEFVNAAAADSRAPTWVGGDREAAIEAPPLERLGRYVLIERLGSGGFGTVWRALDGELGREVAIKLPRLGRLSNARDRERFLREARSAARLRHPGIVGVLDAGKEGETPYIVSELVAGLPLSQMLDAGPLEIPLAVACAIDIAQALAHLHEHGVVHRDLKPANILIDATQAAGGRLRPRLTDFGLAKQDDRDPTMTHEGDLLGTPAYMSPEQIQDPHAAGPRSDVYSLGAMLYQMTTGAPPFVGTARMLLLRAIEDDPVPPRRLNERISRDLETVILRSLAKSPEGRYGSAIELAEDLSRVLRNEPILARPIGRAERFARACRKRPITTALAATALGAIAIGTAGVSWQWLRAESGLAQARSEAARADRHFREARRAVRDSLSLVGNSELLNADGMQPLRKKLLSAALEYNQKFVSEAGDDPEPAFETATALCDMAKIHELGGDLKQAAAEYRAAIPALERLSALNSHHVEILSTLGLAHQSLGVLYDSFGESEPARRELEQGALVLARAAAEAPGSPDALYLLANNREHEGNLRARAGDFEQALLMYRLVDETLAPIAQKPAGALDDRSRSLLAGALGNAGVIHFRMGAAREGLDRLSRCRDLRAELARDYPNVSQYAAELAASESNLGRAYWDLGEPDRALEAFERSRTMRSRLAAANPTVARRQADLASIELKIGGVLQTRRRFDEALASYRAATAILEALLRKTPEALAYRRDLAVIHNNIASILEAKNDLEGVLRELELSRDLKQKNLDAQPDNIDFQEDLASAESGIGRTLLLMHRPNDALPTLEHARELRAKIASERPQIALAAANLGLALQRVGEVQLALGRIPEGISLLESAIERQTEAVRRAPRLEQPRSYLVDHFERLIEALLASDRVGEADSAARRLAAILPDDPQALIRASAAVSRSLKKDPGDARFTLACDLVAQAVAAGYDDFAELRSNPAFEPLFSDPASRLRLLDLAFPADPFAQTAPRR